MGAAELGRELGDAGGPLLVAGIATVAGLGHGYAVLAVLLAAGALVHHRAMAAPPPDAAAK